MNDSAWPALRGGDVPRRLGTVTGVVAMFLPFAESGAIDWDGAQRLAERVQATGLQAVFGADTGFGHNLTLDELERLFDIAGASFATGWYGGVAIGDQPGTLFRLDDYRPRIEMILARGGTPMIMQSYAITSPLAVSPAHVLSIYREIAGICPQFLAHELGKEFNPRGAIYPREVVDGLIRLPACKGLKYSGLDGIGDLRRAYLRDLLRPDFLALTGNDLMIDLFTHTGGWLLGAAAPVFEYYALRDRMWQSDDPRWQDVNAALQALATVSFLPPIPAYRSSVAHVLTMRGLIASSRVHPLAPVRPADHFPVLATVWERLKAYEPWLTDYHLA